MTGRATWTAARALLLALAALVVVASHGQTARADDADEARFHDALARRHYAARRYEQAAREFFYVQRLAPNPRIVFNLALCFDRLGRVDDAFVHYRAYLDGEDADPVRRRAAGEALAALSPRVARVHVESDPPGAEIFVDQREHGSYGRTPRVVVLPEGAHTLSLALAGHDEASVEVTAVAGREVDASATLARIVGSLRVEAPGAGTVRVLDAGGVELAHGPLPFETVLAPGDYAVEVDAERTRTWRSLARVRARDLTTIEARPEALPAPTGALTVTSNVTGALVEIDGVAAGFAPLLLPDLPVGTRRVRASHAGRSAWEGEVRLGDGARGWLTIGLEEPTRTTRSDATWVVGGVGLAAVAGFVVTGALALDQHARFEAAAGSARQGLRETGLFLDGAADVLLAVGAVGLVTAVILYFATETSEGRPSSATFTESDP